MDALAKERATKQDYHKIDLIVLLEFDLQGAKLAVITQTTAYYAIEQVNRDLELD